MIPIFFYVSFIFITYCNHILQPKDGGTPAEWDDRPTTRDFSSADGTPVADPEPPVTDVAGTAKDLALKVFAIADNPKFECDLKPILFRPTMMFQVEGGHVICTHMCVGFNHSVLQITLSLNPQWCFVSYIVSPTSNPPENNTLAQTRSFSFPLVNTSSAKMDFRFSIMSPDGARMDTSGLYSVSPGGGIVEPGATLDVTVKVWGWRRGRYVV